MRLRSERILCGIVLTISLFLSQPVLAVSAPPTASSQKQTVSQARKMEMLQQLMRAKNRAEVQQVLKQLTKTLRADDTKIFDELCELLRYKTKPKSFQPADVTRLLLSAGGEKNWNVMKKLHDISGDAKLFHALMQQNAPQTFAYIGERLRRRPFPQSQYSMLTTEILTAYKTPNPKFFKKDQTKEQYLAQLRSAICQWIDQRITARKQASKERLEFEFKLLIKIRNPEMVPCMKRFAANTKSKKQPEMNSSYQRIAQSIGNAKNDETAIDAYNEASIMMQLREHMRRRPIRKMREEQQDTEKIRKLLQEQLQPPSMDEIRRAHEAMEQAGSMLLPEESP